MADTLRCAVIGVGSLGYHHARILASMEGVELVGIFDTEPENAARAVNDHGTRAFDRLEDVADAAQVVVVAAPTVAHADLGAPLLERGIHVLVEKPMASSLAEADRLLAAAEKTPGTVLAVGHVEFYNPAVQALLALGQPSRFLEVQRLSTFTPRSLDVDVVLDLMIHDLQILHALDPSPIAEVRATGIDVLSPRIDIANVRIELESGAVANLTASRVSAERVRKLRVFQPQRYYSLDYQKQEIKGFRLEDGEALRKIVPDDQAVESREPLRAELEAFTAACRGETVPFVDGAQGRRALATALAITAAIAEQKT
ncbi:MAG: Gfo/Idh/MocA family oxidoreductase [Acidobacteriota bacterium]